MVNADEEGKSKPPAEASDSSKEFKKEELDALTRDTKDKKKGSDKGDSKSSKDDDDFVPFKFNPKEDYQVRQALTALKSYEVFKKISDGKHGQVAADASK